MIAIITPNPTIDRALIVPRLEPGEVHRAVEVHYAAGGKGLNVARSLKILGGKPFVLAPLAGWNGRWFAELAASEGLQGRWTWRKRGETRNCHLLQHHHSDATVINEPGTRLSLQDWDRFVASAADAAPKAEAIVVSGSFPPVPDRYVNRLVATLARSHKPVFVDTSGVALKLFMARSKGFSFKVNFAELTGGEDHLVSGSLAESQRRAAILLDRGASAVIVTHSSEGAAAFSAAEAIWAVPPKVNLVSSVGSGDAFLAGLVLSLTRGSSLRDAVTQGTACGAANAMGSLPGRFLRSEVRRLQNQVVVEAL